MKQRLSPAGMMRTGVVAALVLGSALAAKPHVAEAAVNDISRYCTVCWRNVRLHPDAWPDCTQDVFTRLLERVDPGDWCRILSNDGDERREFLRAIDAVKKRTQRTRRYAGLVDGAIADGRDLETRLRADDRQAVAVAATELLSPRQREVLRLSFAGWSVQEIADELNVGPERVSDEKYKAIQKLRSRLSRA